MPCKQSLHFRFGYYNSYAAFCCCCPFNNLTLSHIAQLLGEKFSIYTADIDGASMVRLGLVNIAAKTTHLLCYRNHVCKGAWIWEWPRHKNKKRILDRDV